MSRRKRLDDAGVAALKVKPKRYAFADPELPGHYVRVSPNGTRAFWAVARDPNRKQHWRLVGAPPMKIDAARKKAADIIRAIRQAPPDSFEGVALEWFKRHVEKNQLRSAPDLRRFFDNYIQPAFAGMDFAAVRRKEISKLLDKLEDKHGARQADYGLSIIRQICNWQAARDDNYASPIVRGMVRHGVKKRDRILSDDEIRAVWSAAEANGSFGAFVRLCLLTAQRRNKIATMKWSDVVNGVWAIASEDREKGNADELVLPQIAVDIIEQQRPRVEKQKQIKGAQKVDEANPYVFAGRGKSHFSGYSKAKAAFDAKVKIAPWVLHDLRRSARSLLSAAGVRPDIAERVMGHAIPGVESVYDRHSYRDEKADALLRLATRISVITTPPPGNVTAVRKSA